MPTFTTELTNLNIEVESLDIDELDSVKFWTPQKLRFRTYVKDSDSLPHDFGPFINSLMQSETLGKKIEKLRKSLNYYIGISPFREPAAGGCFESGAHFEITATKKKYPITAENISRIVKTFYEYVDGEYYTKIKSHKEFDNHF